MRTSWGILVRKLFGIVASSHLRGGWTNGANTAAMIWQVHLNAPSQLQPALGTSGYMDGHDVGKVRCCMERKPSLLDEPRTTALEDVAAR